MCRRAKNVGDEAQKEGVFRFWEGDEWLGGRWGQIEGGLDMYVIETFYLPSLKLLVQSVPELHKVKKGLATDLSTYRLTSMWKAICPSLFEPNNFYAPRMEFRASSFCPVCYSVAIKKFSLGHNF